MCLESSLVHVHGKVRQQPVCVGSDQPPPSFISQYACTGEIFLNTSGNTNEINRQITSFIDSAKYMYHSVLTKDVYKGGHNLTVSNAQSEIRVL